MRSPHPHLIAGHLPQCGRPAGGGGERRDEDGQADLKAGGEQGPDGKEGKGATSGAGDEAVAELEVTAAASTVFTSVEGSAGISEAEDDAEEKFNFFLKNSSRLLAFLLRVEGLDLFFSTAGFTLLSLVSREKEKVELAVRLKVKSLPWLANAWQKARH